MCEEHRSWLGLLKGLDYNTLSAFNVQFYHRPYISCCFLRPFTFFFDWTLQRSSWWQKNLWCWQQQQIKVKHKDPSVRGEAELQKKKHEGKPPSLVADLSDAPDAMSKRPQRTVMRSFLMRSSQLSHSILLCVFPLVKLHNKRLCKPNKYILRN